MHSKNKQPMDVCERAHVARVKSMCCALCAAAAPSEAHEIVQGLWYTSVPLCFDCHRGPDGWHGTKARWRLFSRSIHQVLNETLRMLFGSQLYWKLYDVPAKDRFADRRSKRSDLSSDKIIKRKEAA